MKPRRWRKVSAAEFHRVVEYLRKRDICYNGCTGVELNRRYGQANVKHRMGLGWYKLTRRP